MKTLKIEIPEGHEIDQEKSNLAEGKIQFKQSKKQLVKSWEEIKRINGHYVTNDSKVTLSSSLPYNHVKNTFTTKEQAKASIALAQLSQLRDVYRQGWTPDWNCHEENKFCVEFFNNNLLGIDVWQIRNCFLSFQSREIAQEFLNNFRVLIEQARPLVS
jgi:hypothetical protein